MAWATAYNSNNGTVTSSDNSMQSYPSVYSPYGGSNLAYDSSSDLYLPDTNLDSVRQQMVDLYNTIGSTYEGLINAGRTDLAYNLREASDRLSASGSELGVNSWARQQAITDLTNEMNAAQQVTDNEYLVQMLQQQQSALSDLAQLDAESFNQAMQIYNAAQSQANYEEQQAASADDGMTSTEKTLQAYYDALAAAGERQDELGSTDTESKSTSTTPYTSTTTSYDNSWGEFPDLSGGTTANTTSTTIDNPFTSGSEGPTFSSLLSSGGYGSSSGYSYGSSGSGKSSKTSSTSSTNPNSWEAWEQRTSDASKNWMS